jgi:hypothetical protein
MVRTAPGADHVHVSRHYVPGRSPMTTAQLVIVAVLSLAVVALLMVRQRQTD